MFPKSGAPMEADTHFQALPNISLGSPVKDPSLKAPYETVVRKFEGKRPVLRCWHKCADDNDVNVRGTVCGMNRAGVSRG